MIEISDSDEESGIGNCALNKTKDFVQETQVKQATKRPITSETISSSVILSKVSKTARNRVIDTGGGFLIEDDFSTADQQVKVVFEPGAVLDGDQCMCEECDRPFMESYLLKQFNKSVCDNCKEMSGDKYKLLTKTDAKTKYLLKDCDLDKREPVLKFVVKKNPRHEKWGEMKLYLECQVAARAVEVYGSTDQIEKEKDKKVQRQEKAQQRKFEKNVQALRMAMQATQPTKQHVSHKHDYSPEVYDSDSDQYTKTCKTCGHAVTFEKM